MRTCLPLLLNILIACMYNNGHWGTDADLVAASALLQMDIYVANKYIIRRIMTKEEICWSRIRASNNNNNNNNNHALYKN